MPDFVASRASDIRSTPSYASRDGDFSPPGPSDTVMETIRRVVLDMLKPYEPSIVDVARSVAEIDGVDGVNATLLETDQEVQNIKLTVEGDDIAYATLETVVEQLGASVHSIDQIVCGERLVEESQTPQD